MVDKTRSTFRALTGWGLILFLAGCVGNSEDRLSLTPAVPDLRTEAPPSRDVVPEPPQVTAPIADIAPLPVAPLTPPQFVPAPEPCFDKLITPAPVEMVTRQVLVNEAVIAADGTVQSPAIYRNAQVEQAIGPAGEITFETPCADVLTPDFIASVQRALAARGYFSGAVSGQLDGPTTQAIERFQRDQNDVETEILTMNTARTLGLVAVARDAL